jgi:hypothetical protein
MPLWREVEAQKGLQRIREKQHKWTPWSVDNFNTPEEIDRELQRLREALKTETNYLAKGIIQDKINALEEKKRKIAKPKLFLAIMEGGK